MNNIEIIIKELIEYGKVHLDLDELDSIYVRNEILDLLKLDSISEEELDLSYIKDLKVPDSLLEKLKNYLENNNFENPDLLLVRIMGLLSPLPSQVVKKVNEKEKEQSGKGMDYLFDLEIKNNYIQKTAIDKNIYFKKQFEDNFLEITINLSKPEKNNKEIAKLLVKTNKEKYPKCLLCKENLGYKGRIDHPARGNIRIVPVKLNNENWFIQYSPYAYFDHHIIVINDNHSNMSINNDTFLKLLEFVNIHPTYFVGSNADLPIVGGSILNHEHYQGGTHLLPVFFAQDRKVYLNNNKVKISTLAWYNSIVRIEGKNIEEVVKYARIIFNAWKNYNDESVDILSHSEGNRHNTITPIARKINDTYSINLILRNNRCNELHPDGIFHAHKEYHHIKQEGIGLIEAMGLFILPPRLKRQMGYVLDILKGKENKDNLYKEHEDLLIHENMIDELIKNYGSSLNEEKAQEVINDYIASTCRNILKNTAVFKDDEKGLEAFDKFINESGVLK